MPEEALYLYCFAHPGAAEELSVCGVDGRGTVAAVERGELAAVTSRVSLAEFGGDGMGEHSAEPEWLIPRAWRHEKVVEAVMARSPVLPVRFGALFSSGERVENLLAERGRAILEFLAYCSDKEEWAVKARLDRSRAHAWLVASEPSARGKGLAGRLEGARYLQQKRLRYRAETRLRPWLRRLAGDVRRQLEEQALGVCPVASRFAEQGDAGGRAAFQFALLVLRRRFADFRARVSECLREHGPKGLALELSGPWPPYNFCPPIGMGET